MKTVFKKIGLSLAAFACAISAGVGVALSVPQTTEANAATVTLADHDYYISGTGVRLVNDKNGAGLRFHTNLLASEYAKVEESGTLIIPEFRYDGELTLDDLNNESKSRPTHIVTMGTVNGEKVNYWRDFDVDGEAFKRATVYLHDIPEKGYGTRMVVVSYVKIDGQYVYTSVLDGSNYISLSTAATRAMNATDDADLDARLAPFVVEETKVTFVMPDGSKTTQTVAYGDKLTAPTINYSEKFIDFKGWIDQYGNVWDFEYDVATYPVTLTATLENAEWKQIAKKVFGDGYSSTDTANAERRAWRNYGTPEVLKSGVPAGFNVLNKFEWHKESQGMWKAGGNPFYRSAYDQTDLSVYTAVKFGLKVETEGDAHIKLANGTKITNEWVTFELIQTSANVWTLNVYRENGTLAYSKEGVTKSTSGLQDRNSIASLIFGSNTTQASLMPASTTTYDVNVYTTDVVGVRNDQLPVHPSANTTVVFEHIWNPSYMEGGVNEEAYWSDMAAPSGFTKVTEYSWTGKGDFPVIGHLSASTDISKYSDLYFAMKLENGTQFYIQGAAAHYTGSEWLYVHVYQAEDGTWSKDFVSEDGYTCFGVQKGLTDTTLTALVNYKSGGKRGSYPSMDANSGLTATVYFTELRGISKDGAAAPVEETCMPPENAVTARAYVWRDDLYTNGTNAWSYESDLEPEGYNSLLTHTWHSTRTGEYTYCFDDTLDISLYSDLYFAMKLVNGSHIYVRNSSAGDHYYGSEWLYVHYSKNTDGTWKMEVESLDGYRAYSKQNYTSTTFRGLVDSNLYAYRTDTSVTTTVYYTELRGILEEENAVWGDERAVWSAVDKSEIATEFTYGMPMGFEKLYKKANFTMNDFANLDLSDGYYDQLRFGIIANVDMTFKAGYAPCIPGETTPRAITNIMLKLSAKPPKATMNVFTLTNLGNGNWQVDIDTRIWGSAPSGGSAAQAEGTFTINVSGNSIRQILSNMLTIGKNATVYCTEVRGTHTHKVMKTVSLGNGQTQAYCGCGKAMADPVDFAHGIPAEAETILPSLWREDNYALSASTTMAVPVGFTNIKEYDWLGNTANGGKPWGATDGDGNPVTNMSTYCYNEVDDVSGYTDLYFAIKIVGGKDIYVRHAATFYTGGDWLYVHYQQTGDGVWKQTVRSVDGYECVIEGIVGTTLKEMMGWGNDANHAKNGFFPRRNADQAPKVYFTDVRAVATPHEHAIVSYVSNGNGEHNAVCDCGKVMATENCYGGTATCVLPATCSVCGSAYGATLAHNYVWSIGKYACESCGDVAQAGVKAANNIVHEPFLGQALVANADLGGVTAPAGFSNVQRFDSSTDWTTSALGAGYFNRSGLGVYSQLWFAIKLSGCYLNFAGKATDYAKGEWVNIHFTRVGEYTWNIEVSIDGKVYYTIENQDGLKLDNSKPDNSLARMLYDGGYQSTDGNAILIYHSKNGTASIYSTEVIGILDPYMNAHAVKVADSIWRSTNYALSASTSEPAPAGFTMVKEYNWTGNTTISNGVPWGSNLNDFPSTCLDTIITDYQEIYFAMKLVNGKGFFVRSGTSYTGGDWLYYHLVKGSDGLWSLTIRTNDGYEYINVFKGFTGTTIADLIHYKGDDTEGNPKRGVYPTKTADQTDVRVYMTDMWAVLDGTTHTASKYESNGDGTHDVLCECGYALQTSIPCAGGSATCSQQAICSDCGGAYGDVLQHVGEWNANNEFICINCGANIGQIDTKLDKQTVALFTNATSIEANKTTGLVIDLSKAIPMSISSVKSVALDSLTYDGATLSGNKITIPVIPQKVFGEYTATVTIVVEGREFEITVPVLVVTNKITTAQGMLDMKYVLRGKTDTLKKEGGTAYKAGEGGLTSMNGNGYYMLGNDITLPSNAASKNNDAYAWGTQTLPFKGTFDGNGHTLNGYDETSNFDTSTGLLLENGGTNSYDKELEASIFGYLDGKIRNVAFTGLKLGVFTNIVLDGKGIVEDVYVEIVDSQRTKYVEIAPFFRRNYETGQVHGTMRNVVFNLEHQQMSYPTDYVKRIPAVTGNNFIAENVAVYAFNKAWIDSETGRGNIFYAYTTNDGSEYGIYAEYTDGTNNGGLFTLDHLDPTIWKMVNGKPYLMNIAVSGTATAPSQESPSQYGPDLDGYLTNNGETQYYIAWEKSSGAAKAVTFIRNTMKAATGVTLTVGGADVDNLWKKQIIIGSYANYGDKIDGLDMSTLADDSYGLYLVNKTIFLLAESNAAFEFAAEEFCRRMFGWTEIAPNEFTYYTAATVALPSAKEFNYTTEITFDVRQSAFTNVSAEKTTMNFSTQSPYTPYKEMHNAFDYFENYTGDKTNFLNVNSETDEKEANKEVHGEQLCYLTRGNKTSFEAMLGHVVSEIVAYAQEKPTMTAINFMIEDDPDYCGCEACKKFSNPSITQLIFLNELSYALAHNEYLVSQGRTIAVEFFAYSSFYHAPIMTDADVTALSSLKSTLGLKANYEMVSTSYDELNAVGGDMATYAAAKTTTKFNVLKAEDNLRLYWTSHKANHSFALSHEANDHMYLALLAWIASVGAENIDVFMYQTSFWDLQLPLNTWEYQIKWYQELDALGIGSFMFNLGNTYNPAESQTAFSAFKAYIDSRAMTDLNVTFEQLKDEFFGVNGYYGAAGTQMRVFFEELVSAMERKKQGSDTSILKDNGDDTTEYVDSSQFRYYATDAGAATPAYWRIQAFFNGVYGLSEGSLLFKQTGGSHNSPDAKLNTSVTIQLEKAAHAYDLYVYDVYDKNKTQLETLMDWQEYCKDALKTSGLTEEQIKRIKAEAVFPEYAMLLFYTDYSVTFTRAGGTSSQNWTKGATVCNLQSDVTDLTSVSGGALTYQSLYDMMKSLGFETPSEQYGYDSVSKTGKTQTIGAGYMNMEYQYKNWIGSTKSATLSVTLSDCLYHSAFKNWGVTL